MNPFYAWIKELSWKWKSLVSGSVLVAIVQALFKNFPVPVSDLHFDAALATLQTLIVLGLSCAVSLIDPKVDDKRFPQASKAVHQFRVAWVFLWAAWALFWVVWTAHRWVDALGIRHPELLFTLVVDAANLLNTLGIVACFSVLSRRTTGDARRSFSMVWTAGGALIAIVVIAEAICLNIPPADEYAVNVVKWLAALTGGCSLCLFVGRIESKTIDTPLAVVLSLYLYAIMQGGYPLFREHSSILELIFTNLFIVFKCVLFLFVTWLLTSGYMLYYMESVAELMTNGAKKRKKFIDDLED